LLNFSEVLSRVNQTALLHIAVAVLQAINMYRTMYVLWYYRKPQDYRQPTKTHQIRVLRRPISYPTTNRPLQKPLTLRMIAPQYVNWRYICSSAQWNDMCFIFSPAM